MITSEEYYALHLKDRSLTEITSVIRGLRITMGKLKRSMERPGKRTEDRKEEALRLEHCRLYLERAAQAMEEAGGSFAPSASERAAAAFDAAIPHICRLTLSRGSFFIGFENTTIHISGNSLYKSRERALIPHSISEKGSLSLALTREELCAGLAALHLGEWHANYDAADYPIELSESEQWALMVDYDDGRSSFCCGGSDIYPYNYRELLRLMEL